MPQPRPGLAAERLQRLASRARTLAVFYFLLLFIGTHLPGGPPGPSDFPDKWAHFGGYFLLTVSVLIGWELTIGTLQPKHYFAVWLAGTMYGAFDEWTQIPVGRTCDMNDWMADVLGIVCGLLAFRLGRAAFYWILSWGGPMPTSER